MINRPSNSLLSTTTVVDSTGNAITDYNGTIQVADCLGLTGTGGYGLIDSRGNFVAANMANTYQVTNGQVTFKIEASGDASATQTLTTSALSNAPSGVNINYGTLTVDQTATNATQPPLPPVLRA
ncbi:MAG: hypothetical protein M1499_06310 [Firmicutes bacterium]|jgi:hypothetical protein|nr:hypothetical protein [Bacillota bacterium]